MEWKAESAVHVASIKYREQILNRGIIFYLKLSLKDSTKHYQVEFRF